jgi:hypothetical protein
VDREPEGASVPLHAFDPLHESAFVDDHDRVEEPPLETEVGLAPSETVGTGITVTVADALSLPPVPEQLSE